MAKVSPSSIYITSLTLLGKAKESEATQFNDFDIPINNGLPLLVTYRFFEFFTKNAIA